MSANDASPQVDKYALYAQLDNMQKAINSYRDYKNDGYDNPCSPRQATFRFGQQLVNESVMESELGAPTFENYLHTASTSREETDDRNGVKVVHDYCAEDITENPILEDDQIFEQETQKQDQEAQCDLHSQEVEAQYNQVKAIEKEMQNLIQVNADLKTQNQDLQDQLTQLSLQVEQLTLNNQELEENNEELEKKQGEFLKQADEMLGIVQDQTEELKMRDERIEELQGIEDEMMRIKCMRQEKANDREIDLENENEALKQIVEEMKDKLASEFNKKRQQKQDYESRLYESQDELDYYREKYEEQRSLLNTCREQLQTFEEINEARNDIIYRLEEENSGLKSRHCETVYSTMDQSSDVRFRNNMNHVGQYALTPRQTNQRFL